MGEELLFETNEQEQIQNHEQESNNETDKTLQSDNEELEIEIDNIGKQKDTTTSLCDRFGVYIYSEDFMKKEKVYQESKKKQNEEILKAVFENTGEPLTEDAFSKVMQAETTAVLKAEYETGNEAAGPFAMCAYVLAGVLLAGTGLFLLEKRRRRKANETDSDNY